MLRLVNVTAAALVATVGGAIAETPAIAQTPIERGSYLVNAVMACDGCHTPRPGGVFDMTKWFSGGSQVWDEKAYTVRGSNITPDRETGIGAWTDAEIKRALTQGIGRDGRTFKPP